MIIPVNLSEIQIEILSILFHVGCIPFSKLGKILEYNIFKTSMGADNVNKIADLVIELENKAKNAFKHGEDTAKLIAGMNRNLLLHTPTTPQAKDRSISKLEHNVLNLESLGLIVFDGESAECEEINIDKKFKNSIRLSSEGMTVSKKIVEERRIDFRVAPNQRDTIFIASAFGHDDLDNLFEKELLPACEKYGYKPIRVDINEPTQTITDYIIESILKCECVIADLTYARPSVYFEVGFAHGQGIPLLLTCRKDHFKGKSDSLRVHFDLEQYKISYWLIDKNNIYNWAAKMSPTMRLKNLIKSKFKIDSNNKN